MPESRFLRACRRQPVDATPIWFMRQAGRALPEYRALRARYDFMTLAREPDLCGEVTLQPVTRLGVDAAILFADIMTPLLAIGLDLALVEGVGPVIADPIRAAADLARLRPLAPEEDLPWCLVAIRRIKGALPGHVPLIGFAGAPFTLAAYLVEGKSSRQFTRLKVLLYGEPELWHTLMDRLTALTITYLDAQIAAGVDAVQIFDSWVGALGPRAYARAVAPYMRRIAAALARHQIPVILFGTETAALLDQIAVLGASVIGVDWRIALDSAWRMIGHDLAIQGNLDPAALLAPWPALREEAAAILDQAGGRPGHIFNLGHGVLPETPVANLERLVEFVHQYQAPRWADERADEATSTAVGGR